MTLIKAARTMLADSLLPIPFWAEVVNTACYVYNRVLETKPHNKTPYELLHGRTPSIGFMRPFGCPVTILNTLDPLGKFEEKVDEGFLVGYSISSKAFREHDFDAKKPESEVNVSPSSSAQSRKQDHKTKKEAKGKSPVESFIRYRDLSAEFEDYSDNSSNEVNATSSIVPTVRQNSPNSTNTFSAAELEDISYSNDEDVVGAEADFNNLETSITIYIDDIIFGATNKDLCKYFEKLMKDKLQMSSIGELAFFLGLQVKQKKDGIFLSQDKYVAKILRKFGLTEGKSASTPIDTEKPLLKDPDGEDVDVHTYRLISWQCKKQTVIATSSTEAEYMAAANCCAQVLWI
nr:ribonuclease H-like domain-containing protein [Tanacetum cinerariifolium]